MSDRLPSPGDIPAPIADQVDPGTSTSALFTPYDSAGEYEPFFEPLQPEQDYVIGCSDDREPTPDSAKELHLVAGFIRRFGAEWGIARATAVSYRAQQLINDGDAHLPDDFISFGISSTHRITNLTNGRIRPLSHVPCAYAGGIGMVTYWSAFNEQVLEIAAGESEALFGDSAYTEVLAQANEDVGRQTMGQDYRNVSIDRETMERTPHPIMVVAGSHADPKSTIVVASVQPGFVTRPDLAVAQGKPFYSDDIATSGEIILDSFPDLDLRPDLVVRAMFHEIPAVRHALTNGNPAELGFAVRGNVQDLITHLERYKRDSLNR